MDFKYSLIKNQDILGKINLPSSIKDFLHTDRAICIGALKDKALIGIGIFRYSDHNEAFLVYISVDDEHIRKGAGRGIINYAAHFFKKRGCPVIRLTVSGSLDDLYDINTFLTNVGFRLYDTLRHRLIIDKSCATASKLFIKRDILLGHFMTLTCKGRIDKFILSHLMHLGSVPELSTKDTRLMILLGRETKKPLGYIVYRKTRDRLLIIKKIHSAPKMERRVIPALISYIFGLYTGSHADSSYRIVIETDSADYIYNGLINSLGEDCIDETVNEYLMVL